VSAFRKAFKANMAEDGVNTSTKKLTGYDFYRSLGSPKYVVAPMVDQSELVSVNVIVWDGLNRFSRHGGDFLADMALS